MWVRSLGEEESLEQEVETHSSIPVWKIPWTAEPGGLQSMGSQRAEQDLATEQQQQQNIQFILWKYELLISTISGIFIYLIYF